MPGYYGNLFDTYSKKCGIYGKLSEPNNNSRNATVKQNMVLY